MKYCEGPGKATTPSLTGLVKTRLTGLGYGHYRAWGILQAMVRFVPHQHPTFSAFSGGDIP